jgi:hypothetical protein
MKDQHTKITGYRDCMTLHDDATRCTGKQDTPDVNFTVPCPVREQCRRYTDKPSPRAVG